MFQNKNKKAKNKVTLSSKLKVSLLFKTYIYFWGITFLLDEHSRVCDGDKIKISVHKIINFKFICASITKVFDGLILTVKIMTGFFVSFKFVRFCSNSGFMLCVKSVRILVFLFRIRTEYEDLWSNSPYSVQMWENWDKKNSEYGHFSSSDDLKSARWWNALELVSSHFWD